MKEKREGIWASRSPLRAPYSPSWHDLKISCQAFLPNHSAFQKNNSSNNKSKKTTLKEDAGEAHYAGWVSCQVPYPFASAGSATATTSKQAELSVAPGSQSEGFPGNKVQN